MPKCPHDFSPIDEGVSTICKKCQIVKINNVELNKEASLQYLISRQAKKQKSVYNLPTY